MSVEVPKFKLNGGTEIPAIGLGTHLPPPLSCNLLCSSVSFPLSALLTTTAGTWQSKPDEVINAVEHALRNGYRHIDCAWGYGNEKEVGEGIRRSGVPREEIFVCPLLRIV